jgi:excisionase family DNA binding protein
MAETVPVMLTIHELHEKNPSVPENAIRRLVLSGELRAVKTGRKYLICESVFHEFLIAGNNQRAAGPVESGKIRRLY